MTAELEDQGIAQGEGERIAGIYQKTLNKRALRSLHSQPASSFSQPWP